MTKRDFVDQRVNFVSLGFQITMGGDASFLYTCVKKIRITVSHEGKKHNRRYLWLRVRMEGKWSSAICHALSWGTNAMCSMYITAKKCLCLFELGQRHMLVLNTLCITEKMGSSERPVLFQSIK